jgi:toxin CcdB
MARFDFYKMPKGGGFLVDVQADLLSDLRTRLVVPLRPITEITKPMTRLNPIFKIGNVLFAFMPQQMAAIPLNELKERLGSLADHHNEMVTALDMVLQGF